MFVALFVTGPYEKKFFLLLTQVYFIAFWLKPTCPIPLIPGCFQFLALWCTYEDFCHCADHYLLFDFPGQVELFFLHENAKRVIMKLIKRLNLRVWLFKLFKSGSAFCAAYTFSFLSLKMTSDSYTWKLSNISF